MSVERDTICALSTSVGQAAVGMVRLSGPRARELLRQVCSRRRFRPRQMHAVQLRDGGQIVDRVLACHMPAPRSYTGEDVVEVFGHGGALNMERILHLFLDHGARLAQPGEFTRRAFLEGRLDLIQAEAVAHVVAARSERALSNAQTLLEGALGQRLAALRQELLQLCAMLEASLDFAEDTASEVALTEVARHHQHLERELEAVVGTYRRGKRLEGVTVGLRGRVNVGKSSLFNALLQRERALVDHRPGTTRDYLEADVDWQGYRVTLVDTAGDGPEGSLSAMEQAGQRLASSVLARCDLVVWVVDATHPLDHAPRGGAPIVVVANKVDLLTPEVRTVVCRALAGEYPVVETSAVTGEGLDRLRGAVLGQLFDSEVEGESVDAVETVQLVHRRQWDALRRARGRHSRSSGARGRSGTGAGGGARAGRPGLSGGGHG